MSAWVRGLIQRVTAAVPSALRSRELSRFALVGAIAFVIDTTLFLVLKSTVLVTHPITAKFVAVLVAITFSYALNRQWSFHRRGGRPPHQEAFLFYLISFLAVVLNIAPLWLSRYAFGLEIPNVSRFTQNLADFISAQLVGTLAGMGFRFWAFVRFVFPVKIEKPA